MPIDFLVEVHTNGKSLTLKPPPHIATATSLTIKSAVAEFYDSHQPLETLNSTSVRNPISTADLGVSGKTADLHTSIDVESPIGPPNAKFMIYVIQGETNSSLTKSWIEVPYLAASGAPVIPEACSCCRWIVILLIVIVVLLFIQLLCCCRRSRKTAA